MDKNYIDLHIHTTNSDGYFSPKEIVKMIQVLLQSVIMIQFVVCQNLRRT